MSITKEKAELTLKKVFAFLKENKEDLAIQEMTELLMEIEEDKKKFVEKSELRELIIEIREGFRRMDERFAMMDKRFEDLIHYMDKRFEEVLHYVDKRFEAVDKRFEEILHYVDKRFESVDKRFEDMNKRFNFLQWFIGIAMSIFFSIITIFFSYIAYSSQKQTDLIIQQLENLQKVIVEQSKQK